MKPPSAAPPGFSIEEYELFLERSIARANQRDHGSGLFSVKSQPTTEAVFESGTARDLPAPARWVPGETSSDAVRGDGFGNGWSATELDVEPSPDPLLVWPSTSPGRIRAYLETVRPEPQPTLERQVIARTNSPAEWAFFRSPE